MKLFLTGVSNLTDARYAAAEGFDGISFDFRSTSDLYIADTTAKEIIKWLSMPVYSGRFDGQSEEEIIHLISLTGINSIEIPWSQRNNIRNLWNGKVFAHVNLQTSDDRDSFFTDMIQDPDFLSQAEHIIIFSGDINILTALLPLPCDWYFHLEKIADLQLVHTCQPNGYILNGTQENRPGYSNWEDIESVLTEIRKAHI